MLGTSIEHTGRALQGAVDNYASSLVASTAPLDSPAGVSKALSRNLGLVALVSQPAAQAARVAAAWAGELAWYALHAALLVLRQLNLLPTRLTNGGGGGEGLAARDELAAFKLVGAALLVAYLQVRPQPACCGLPSGAFGAAA